MMTYYGRVVRWSVPLTSVVATVAVVICAVFGGSKGAYGALIGVGVVTIFFAISLVVVSRAAKVSPMAMMIAALASFVGKIVAFMIVLAVMRHFSAYSFRDLGFTALACILAWSAAQVGVAMKLNFPYVEPHGQS
jgi:ATP synthase protein I